MLPPFIIEQIRKREERENTHREQPVRELPLPLPMPAPSPRAPRHEDEGDKRGVIIIDLG